MKMKMKTLEALLYEQKSRVFERIRKTAVNVDDNEVMKYWFTSAKSDDDPTERHQAMILRELHENAAIEIILPQHIDYLAFRIDKERFQQAASFYSNELWATRRAMGAFAMEKVALNTSLPASSFSSGNVAISRPPKPKLLPPPLDWDDTPFTKREHPRTGMVKNGELRQVFSGRQEIEFSGSLQRSTLDYLYQASNRDRWCKHTELTVLTGKSGKQIRDVVNDINKRWQSETKDYQSVVIAVQKQGKHEKSANQYKWAL